MNQIVIKDLSQTNLAAKEFLEILNKDYSDVRCIVFDGKMGAGKTTFITALCHELKVIDKVSSPTFSIVNEYATKNDFKIYHFDLYRIKDTQEAMATGAEEYIYGNDYCFIEWAQTIMEILPQNTLVVSIEVDNNQQRVITFE